MIPTGAPIPVVAAVIHRDGRYLVGRRPPDKRHGDLWEFPGGKMDTGETMLEATTRELREELDMDVTGIGSTLFSAQDGASGFTIHFIATSAVGEPRALEHSELGWFTPTELDRMALAPSDARFVRYLIGVQRTTDP